MPEPQLFATNQSFFGLVPEATRGTPVTPATVWMPYKSPQQTPTQTYLPDEGLRGNPVSIYDEILGVRHDLMEFKGDVHLDSFGNLIEGILGGTDTITGAGPYVHTIPLLNSAAVGSQPKSYTLYDFNGYQCEQMAGGQLDSVEVAFTIAGSVEYTAKWLGQPFTVVSTPTTQTFSGVDKLIPAWNNAVQIAGVSSPIMVDGTCMMARSTEAVHAAGSQGPVVTFAGPLKVTGKLTFLTVASDAISPAALAYTPQALTFTFTDPASSHTMLLQMSKVQFMNPKYERGKIYVTVSVDYEAEANTTDATAGYSPIKAIVTNAQSTAY
jgi:hypothetical protein